MEALQKQVEEAGEANKELKAQVTSPGRLARGRLAGHLEGLYPADSAQDRILDPSRARAGGAAEVQYAMQA
jgi:hypothetical protein